MRRCILTLLTSTGMALALLPGLAEAHYGRPAAIIRGERPEFCAQAVVHDRAGNEYGSTCDAWDAGVRGAVWY